MISILYEKGVKVQKVVVEQLKYLYVFFSQVSSTIMYTTQVKSAPDK